MKMCLQSAGVQGFDEGICRAQQGGIYFYVLNLSWLLFFALSQCSRMVTAVNLETELHLFTAFQFSLEIFLMGSDQTPGWFLLL